MQSYSSIGFSLYSTFMPSFPTSTSISLSCISSTWSKYFLMASATHFDDTLPRLITAPLVLSLILFLFCRINKELVVLENILPYQDTVFHVAPVSHGELRPYPLV